MDEAGWHAGASAFAVDVLKDDGGGNYLMLVRLIALYLDRSLDEECC